MLMTTDLVKVADSEKKGKSKYSGTFDRPYLQFGTKDELDTEVSKVEVSDGTTVEYSITSPKEKKTKHGAAELLKEALDYFQATQTDVKDEDKQDPVSILLRYADDGLVSALRMKKRNELIPTEVNEDKAIDKMAAVLIQKGKYKDMDSARAAVKLLYS